MRSWSPFASPGWTPEFRLAATCHHVSDDYYGIAAVFRLVSGPLYKDVLYYLVVDGLSSWPDYGNLVAVRTLDASGGTIDSVDCAADSNLSVFVSWSRNSGSNASWVRLTSGSVYGPYAITYDVCDERFRPRIAWNPAGRVTIAFTGAYEIDFSCSICLQTFSGMSGTPYSADAHWMWGDNTPYFWDIEWNGTSRFVMTATARLDGGGFLIGTKTADTHGYFVDPTERAVTFQSWPNGDDNWPRGQHLVFSPTSRNTYQRTVLVTDRKTYWLTTDGGLAGSYSGYTSDPTTATTGCEYWGPRYRISHSFTDPGGGADTTIHRHWNRTATAPFEVYSLNDAYLPAACSSSDTDTDREVVLVSRSSTSPRPVFWNLEPED